MPKHVGFDDDDDDEDDDHEGEEKEHQLLQEKKSKSDKQEMDDDEEEKKENTNTNIAAVIGSDPPHIVNGRDLNAPLCSEDDDTDDGEDLDPADKIICQFTKVVRKKNEWTAELKHGLMHINGKDYAFHKATGGHFSWE